MGIKPHLLIVQQREILELRRLIDCPLACLVDAASGETELPDQTRLQLGRQLISLHPVFAEDYDRVAALQSQVPADADLVEPLDRVHDALKETLRSGAVA